DCRSAPRHDRLRKRGRPGNAIHDLAAGSGVRFFDYGDAETRRCGQKVPRMTRILTNTPSETRAAVAEHGVGPASRRSTAIPVTSARRAAGPTPTGPGSPLILVRPSSDHFASMRPP